MIGPEQRDAIGQVLGEAGVGPDSHTIVAVLHHHLLPVGDAELPASSTVRPATTLTIDSVSVLRTLCESGVQLVLHGHQHAPAVQRYLRIDWDLSPIHVAATGSAGAVDDAHRHFFLWDIDDGAARAHSFKQDDVSSDEFTYSGTLELVLAEAIED